MCNINIAYRKDGRNDEKLSQYMNFASWRSFQHNKDGEGFFSLNRDGGLIYAKGKQKFRYEDIDSYFLCSHQRFSTSGFGEGMEHPHETENFLVVHNGVFWDLGDKEKSDTRIYAEMIQEEFNLCGDTIHALREVNKRVGGSFSVVVYDKITGKVFYFKEERTAMYKVENEQYLIMSTKKENVEFAQFFFNISGGIKEVKPYRIFDVLNGFNKVTKFKKKEVVVYVQPKTNKEKWTWGELKRDNPYYAGESGWVYSYILGRWVRKEYAEEENWVKMGVY